MRTTPRSIHCVFYSHVWAVEQLGQLPNFDPTRSVVVEGAFNSNFAPMLNQNSQIRAGVAALLRPESKLEDVARRYETLSAPVVLAAHPPIPLGAIASGVSNLRFVDGDFESVVLMVSVMDAPQMAAVFVQADEFSCLWDMADPPNFLLAQLGEQLARYQCLGDDSWRGLHFYKHPLRAAIDEQGLRDEYAKVLAEFPGLQSGKTQ